MRPATLSAAQIEAFIEAGFVRVERAFSRETAEAACRILWAETGCAPENPATWTKPVIRLGEHTEPPFVEAANTPRLQAAFDQLVGEGRWLPRMSLGTFPLRFPAPFDPGDAGWHIDVSFAGPASTPDDFFSWRANVASRGRALLMLFLFSDVGEDDAPTRLREGSHLDMAKRLASAAESGMSLRDLAANGFVESEQRRVALATGEAGTVYLCHPFLVHAAQPHRGKRARFLAQPGLLPAVPLSLEREDGAYSPVELAIRKALV